MSRRVDGKTFYNRGWYNSYRSMIRRCCNPNAANYEYYGGRGIRVCDEWREIEKFEEWEKKHPYFPGASLDRIDPNGDYEPSNCRWATTIEQGKNRRNSILIRYHGKMMSITEIAMETGINRSTLKNRYFRGERGWRLTRSVR